MDEKHDRRKNMNEFTRKKKDVRIEHRSEIILAGKSIKTSFKDGRQAREIPPFFHNTVMNHEMDRIPKRRNEEQYCIFIMPPGNDDFEYIIAAETDGSGELPEGMKNLIIPKQDYAAMTFIKRGNQDVMETLNYITQEWLPGSGYKPADGPGFILYGKPFFTIYEKYGYDGNPVAHAFFAITEV